MNFSRQSLLGSVMLLGGGIMLFAMIQQTPSTTTNEPKKIAEAQSEDVVTLTAVDKNGQELEELEVKPLTTDIATESKILEEKQRQREARVKAQERQAQNFRKEQERAAAAALAKTRRENEQFQKNAKAEKQATADNISRPQVTSRQTPAEQQSEAKATDSTNEKAKTTDSPKQPPAKSLTYYAKKGDGLIKLSKEYHVPLEVLAEANDMHILDNLMYGQKLTIPSKAQIAKLEKSAKKSQAKRKAEITAKKKALEKKREQQRKEAEAKQKAKEEATLKAKQKQEAENKRKQQQAKKSTQTKTSVDKQLAEARKTAKKDNAKGTFGVQVALASDQEMAEKVAKKFRKAGYKVKTSQTSRGVRVIVGPERGKVAALALKDKINSDSKVGVNNAWVLYWR